MDAADHLSVVFAYSVSGGVVYLLAKYADLTVNGQSQAILGILVIGAGTDYALLLVARYREELRRHEDRHEAMAFALHRAAPAILASAATVTSACCACSLRRPQLHGRTRSGPRRRRRRHLAGHGDPAARAAGDLRPLDVLAQAPDLPLAPSPPRPASGPGSATGSPPRRARSGPSPPPSWRSRASACSRCRRPVSRPRTATPRSSTRSRVSSCWWRTTLPTTPTPCRWSPTPTTSPRSRRRRPASTDSASPHRRGDRQRSLLLRGDHDR